MFTTYRLTEHHTAGGMSRWLPYLSELQPEMFCEISPELAAEVGLEPYGWATLVSPRAAIEARVLVTRRMTPLTIGGKTIHQIGLPYHWGVGGDATVEGDSANDLLGVTMDPNVFIQNSKYVAGTIMPGRRPRGPELVDFVEKYQREAGLSPESGNQLVTVSDEVVAESLAADSAASKGGHPHRGGDSAVGVTPGRTFGREATDSADDRSGRVDLRPADSIDENRTETVGANRADDGDPTDGDPDRGYIGKDADSAQKGNLGEGARDISGRKDEAADTTTVDNRGNEEED